MGTESNPRRIRDEEILRAAFEVFTDKGFHGATMLDVARRARASKATLYARFENKETLFKALVAWGVRQGADALDAIVADDSVDALTSIHRFAASLLSAMLQPDKLALYRVAVAEGGRLPEIGRIYDSLTREPGMARGRILARRLILADLIEVDDPDDFAHSFIGLLLGEMHSRALLGAGPAPGPEDIDIRAKAAIKRLVRAFAPAAAGG